MIDNPHRLAAAGPRDPAYGFPLYYEDEAGIRLALGLGPDPLLPAVDPLPSPGLPVSLPGNFPGEAFYFLAEARMPIGGAGVVGRARLVLALEAAFGGPGDPDPTARVVFGRIRVRLDDVVPGANYVVTHPYGQTGPLTADDRGRVFLTDDRGIADEDLDAVLRTGRVAPFLRWTAGADLAPGESAAPAGYLGDGVTPHTVTGSPFGTNIFRVDGPRVADGGPVDPVDPTNRDRIQTDRFTVQGRLATVHGASVDTASYDRDGAGTVTVQVVARSVPGQDLELAGVGVPRTALLGAGPHYAARVALPAPGGGLPAIVEVVNVTDDPVTRHPAPLADVVTVTQAEHSPAAGTVTIAAVSSDASGPTVTAVGFGTVTAVPTTFPASAAPARIVVTSTAGGIATATVTLTGPTAPALPIQADAGPDQVVPVGASVTLTAAGTRGTAASWSWSQTAGPLVALTGATGPTAGFTAPAAPATLTFRLEVSGDGGPSQDTVSVTVTPPAPPDVVTIERVRFRTGRQQYRIDGTLTGTLPAEVLVSHDGTELGRSPVDATGAWSVTRTLGAADVGLRPAPGDTVTATSTHGGSDAAPVTIRA